MSAEGSTRKTGETCGVAREKNMDLEKVIETERVFLVKTHVDKG